METSVRHFVKFELVAIIVAVIALICLGVVSTSSHTPVTFKIGLTIFIVIDLLILAFTKKKT
jgi:hypothetical protein